jgi:hypothetical protein
MERHLTTPAAPDRDAIERATELARARQIRRERILVGTWGGATLLALVAMCMLLEGCGHGHSTASSTGTTSNAIEPATAVVASNTRVVSGEGLEPVPQAGTLVEDPGTVPPDVVAAVSDTFVTAGQAIEVTVEGTPDITEMAVSDGRGDAIPMVRDDASQLWRVGYRVPLRPGSERFGLAVTAKNASNRWRRVWVFLNVGDGQENIEQSSPAGDSTEVK